MEIQRKQLKDKLIELRNEEGLKKNNRPFTQKEIANKLGIGETTYKNYELGRIPETSILTKIKRFYNVSYNYLLDDSCLNKYDDTIKVNKYLGLSDKTINIIKGINRKEIVTGGIKNLFLSNENNINTFNYFVENFDDWYGFLLLLEEYYNYLTFEKNLDSIDVLTSSNTCFLYYYYNDKEKLNNIIKLLENNVSIFNNLKEKVFYNQQAINDLLIDFITNLTNYINIFKYKTINKKLKKELYLNYTKIQTNIFELKQLISEKVGFSAYRVTTTFNQFINQEITLNNKDIIEKISEEAKKLEKSFSEKETLKYTFTDETITDFYKQSSNNYEKSKNENK